MILQDRGTLGSYRHRRWEDGEVSQSPSSEDNACDLLGNTGQGGASHRATQRPRSAASAPAVSRPVALLSVPLQGPAFLDGPALPPQLGGHSASCTPQLLPETPVRLLLWAPLLLVYEAWMISRDLSLPFVGPAMPRRQCRPCGWVRAAECPSALTPGVFLTPGCQHHRPQAPP